MLSQALATLWSRVSCAQRTVRPKIGCWFGDSPHVSCHQTWGLTWFTVHILKYGWVRCEIPLISSNIIISLIWDPKIGTSDAKPGFPGRCLWHLYHTIGRRDVETSNHRSKISSTQAILHEPAVDMVHDGFRSK